MFSYATNRIYELKNEITTKFILEKDTYDFLNELDVDDIYNVLEYVHTNEIKVDDEKKMITIPNMISFRKEISIDILKKMKEYKDSFVEVMLNSIKLGIWDTNFKIGMREVPVKDYIRDKFKDNSERKNKFLLERNEFYSELEQLLVDIEQDYYDGFISLFILPLERKALNYNFNPNLKEKTDDDIKEWLNKIVEKLETKIKKMEQVTSEEEERVQGIINKSEKEIVIEKIIQNKINFIGNFRVCGHIIRESDYNIKQIYRKILTRDGWHSKFKKFLETITKKLKKCLKERPDVLVEFFKINYKLKNEACSEIDFEKIEQLEFLKSKIYFMKAYCQINGIKILKGGKEATQKNRNYISDAIDEDEYSYLQTLNLVLTSKGSEEYMEYEKHLFKTGLERLNVENKKEILRGIGTFGNYEKLKNGLGKIKKTKEVRIPILVDEKIDLKGINEKILNIVKNEKYKTFEKSSWPISFRKSIVEYNRRKKLEEKKLEEKKLAEKKLAENKLAENGFTKNLISPAEFSSMDCLMFLKHFIEENSGNSYFDLASSKCHFNKMYATYIKKKDEKKKIKENRGNKENKEIEIKIEIKEISKELVEKIIMKISYDDIENNEKDGEIEKDIQILKEQYLRFENFYIEEKRKKELGIEFFVKRDENYIEIIRK